MLQYSFMRNAFMISILISILCPSIGIFLVLRRHSMIGDTLSHSSLAGIALGLLTKTNPILFAFIFTSFCGGLIEFLRNYFKKYAELILSIVLSLSVGIAITLISSGKIKSNVNSYLFGNILTVTAQDLYTVLALSVLSVVILFVFYNELLYITFDEDGAQVAGIRVKLINYIFAFLVAATISVSIRIVGILVLSSMIALPVAAALQLGRGFRFTLAASTIISIINILSGIVISYYFNFAPGGIIALASVVMLVLIIISKKIFYSVKLKGAA